MRELEEAVLRLSPVDLESFRNWFAEFDAERWDRQIERDASNGKLDDLANEALTELQANRCSDL